MSLVDQTVLFMIHAFHFFWKIKKFQNKLGLKRSKKKNSENQVLSIIPAHNPNTQGSNLSMQVRWITASNKN